jgi:hypothetical protein
MHTASIRQNTVVLRVLYSRVEDDVICHPLIVGAQQIWELGKTQRRCGVLLDLSSFVRTDKTTYLP